MKLPPRSLVSLLEAKYNWEIPREKHLDALHSSCWSMFAKNNPQIRISGPEKYPNLNERVNDYMTSTFYNSAPIPKTLGLSRTLCKDTNTLVTREIDDAIYSGASMLFTKSKSHGSFDIVGCFLNQLWEKNSDYEVVGANARLWHDAASEIAMNHPNKDIQHLIWRKLQFLHIYDLGQAMLNQMPQYKFALYLGAGFANEEVKESNVVGEAFSLYLNNWKTKDCVIYMMTTFSKMEPIMLKRLDNPKVVDEVRYEEEMLELNGVRCFKSCEHLGGIKFFANFNEHGDIPDYNSFPNG